MKIRDLIDYLRGIDGDAEISPEFDLQKWFPKPYPDKEQLHILSRGAAFGSVDVFDPDDEVSEYIENKSEWYAAQTGILMSAARAKVFQTLREGGYLVFSHKDNYSRTAKFKFRPPEEDGYGWARLCQIIGNYFGGDLSIGIDMLNKLPLRCCDNGVYIIEKWKIVGREYTYGKNEQMNYDLCDMVCAINKAQLRKDRLDKQIIKQMLKGESNNADN